MTERRSRKGAEPADDATHDGLSRRGWILLASVTAAVAVGAVVLAVGFIAGGIPGGDSRASASSTLQAAPPHIPSLAPAPTPLGLPPRPTPTHVATVPSTSFDSVKPGDCLQTYDSQWANAYPVVGCSAPHIAQLLTRGVLPQPSGAAFPGTDALDTQVSDLCEPFLNWDWVAVWNEDVQLGLRYPNTSQQWATGTRSYSCFVYTFSRHELTGTAMR
ncbi:septum formation family protein [Leifsonia poae]|uniref:Septum formation-related domain-containing protein n=1 Tax=Leifsonia poae TaxID=110933 RepID=A0A9W6HE12_9MICO|nr:septum formation family protein [Leifsonia poae]GLJ78053.1 hypothetical protein GCM10017584_36270 [Leifsonia poae]